MNEIKRILGNRRILSGFILILLINGFLFAKEQAKNDYGMNLTLPQTELSVSLEVGYAVQTEKAAAKEAYVYYREWLETVKDMPLSEAADLLEQERDRLETRLKSKDDPGDDAKAAYAAVNTLLSQSRYLIEYPNWLDSIQGNKDSMLSFSIFSEPDSFSSRNILKTAGEFEKLQGEKLQLGENGAVEALLTFSMTNYFLLIILMIVSVSFLEEQKKGLWNVVRAAPGGRLCLALKRTAVLFFTSIFAVLLLYGTNLAIGFSVYGGYDTLHCSIQSVALLGGLPLCVLLSAACIAINCYKKPAAEKDLLGGFALRLNGITDRFFRRLHLFGFEAYKTVWIQKGVVVIALFVYFALGLSYTAPVPASNATEVVARQYTMELAGKTTDETISRIETIQSELNQTVADYKAAETAFENGEMEYPQFDIYAREASVAQTKSEGLDMVRKRVEQLREQAREKGFVPYLIAEVPFERVYGEAAEHNRQSAAMLSLLILGLLLAGCMTYEKQSGMTGLAVSAVRGREALLIRKILLAACCAVLAAFERGEIALIATDQPELFSNISEVTISLSDRADSNSTPSKRKVALGGFVPFDYKGIGSGLSPNVVVSNSYLREWFGKPTVARLDLNVSEGYEQNALIALKQIIGNDNQITLSSRLGSTEELNQAKMAILALGGSVSLVIALIGILNFVNTMSVSVMARKRELATQESIGMSSRQIRKMLIDEGLCYAVITLALVLSIGNLIAYGIFKLFQQRVSFAVFTYPLVPAAVIVLAVLAVCFITPERVYSSLNRETIVTQLREAE